jgi:NADH-quinone oxidoreductase subunit N
MIGAIFAVLLLSLAGFPLTGGFIGKLYILRSSLEAGHVILAVSLVLASVISYFYYLRVIVVMYMRPAPSGGAYAGMTLPIPMRIAVSVSAIAVLLLFFLPNWVLNAAQRSVASLFTVPGALFGLGL